MGEALRQLGGVSPFDKRGDLSFALAFQVIGNLMGQFGALLLYRGQSYRTNEASMKQFWRAAALAAPEGK